MACSTVTAYLPLGRAGEDTGSYRLLSILMIVVNMQFNLEREKHKMIVFAFIADGWGAVSGGINCFNYDLARACARLKKADQHTKICCVVPDLTPEEQNEMRKNGMIPITLSTGAFHSPEAVQLISSAIQKERELQRYYPDKCNMFCIGHDIYTGNLSKQLADTCGGWNIVFHHMDYSSYYLLGEPNVSSYNEKTKEQNNVLRSADLICAVGPILLQSAQDISRSTCVDKCVEVFPGLATFEALPTPPNRFNPIVFGRVEKGKQAIKQIPLAIDAFALAISMDKDTPVINNNPTLLIVGYEDGDPDALKNEVCRLQEKTEEIAGRICNVVPRTYTNNRAELGEWLRDASVAMMLSFHEGFGLVGYEAIAAGIPLILSKNTGLYEFLKREQLDHLVYPVQIAGSNLADKYSKDDLKAVAKTLRDIRQNEAEYKKKALDLRNTLLSKKKRYSWEAVADRFIQNVLRRFESDLKSMPSVFYTPDEVTKLSADIKNGAYTDVTFEPPLQKRVFLAEGKGALVSLVACLQKKFQKEYEIILYNAQEGEDAGFVYSDFLNNCWEYFGKKDDIKGSGFEWFLGKRLKKTILILNDFPTGSIPDFENLFCSLNKQLYDFYIFVIFQTNLPVQIRPYERKSAPKNQPIVTKQAPLPVRLTDEQKLIVKILAFRGKLGYSKRLIEYICNGMNTYWNGQDGTECAARFDNPAKMENELEELGLIEEYSEYSYKNAEAYLPEAAALAVDGESYAMGLWILGRFYARCYYRGWNRDQQLGWGYFSCNCFSSAAAIDHKRKSEIKPAYEILLRRLRKKAMDTSDYERYLNALLKFIEQYEKPDDPWLWYALIHCEAIYCPSKRALDRVYHALRMEFPDTEKEKRKRNELYVQLIRLTAELEDELGVPSSLDSLLERIGELAEENPSGTVWSQCFLTVINLAADRKDFHLVDEYLHHFRASAKPDELYPKMIALAVESDLEIEKFLAGYEVDLTNVLSNIKRAHRIAQYKLQDYRAQAWTVGLWGEGQILLKEAGGEGNLQKAMRIRKSSGEKAKVYRNWLHRISKYPLVQLHTKELLEQEMVRTGMQAHTRHH